MWSDSSRRSCRKVQFSKRFDFDKGSTFGKIQFLERFNIEKGLTFSRSQVCLRVVRKIAWVGGKFVAPIAFHLTLFPPRNVPLSKWEILLHKSSRASPCCSFPSLASLFSSSGWCTTLFLIICAKNKNSSRNFFIIAFAQAVTHPLDF